MTKQDLKGARVLVVEDDFYQASEVCEFLKTAGARVVGPAGHAERASRLLEAQAVDAAVVDINLGHGPSFDIARNLRDRNIPFLFLTGYDRATIPDDLAAAPHVEKPAINEHVLTGLIELTGG